MKKLLLLPLVLLALVTAACGSSSDHDDADVTFVQQMIPHHQQAVFMTSLVPDAGAGPEVTALAAQIAAEQGPEIETMRGLLKDWGLNEMSGDMDGMSMDMGDGMASDADLGQLADAKGDAFDQQFLTLMIAHHEGAVEMAKAELADGKDPQATKLARQIIDGQEREIATMKGLLG